MTSPINTEDAFPREQCQNGRSGVTMCNSVKASLPLLVQCEDPCAAKQCLMFGSLSSREKMSVWVRADNWTRPCHFYSSLVSWRTALKQYPQYVTLPILLTKSGLLYIGVCFVFCFFNIHLANVNFLNAVFCFSIPNSHGFIGKERVTKQAQNHVCTTFVDPGFPREDPAFLILYFKRAFYFNCSCLVCWAFPIGCREYT